MLADAYRVIHGALATAGHWQNLIAQSKDPAERGQLLILWFGPAAAADTVGPVFDLKETGMPVPQPLFRPRALLVAASYVSTDWNTAPADAVLGEVLPRG